MFNKQTSVVKYSEIMKIFKNYYTEEEFYMSFTVYTNLSYFPCPDTNGSLIHIFPPYIKEKILMKY